MLSITNNKIYLTRGDSAYIELRLQDESGSDYRPEAGDKIYFRIKKSIFGDAVLLVKEIDTETLALELLPEDTISLEFMTYRYEVELVTLQGKCFTVIANAEFQIGPELEVHE